MRVAVASALVASIGLLVTPTLGTAAAAATAPMTTCALPASGTTFGKASPAQEDLNPAAVQAAILYANTHLRASVQIFRNNCKVAQGLLDPVTDNIPYEIFSSTKSVISILDRHRAGSPQAGPERSHREVPAHRSGLGRCRPPGHHHP